ncbi:DUF2637 domain-containing protein [Streptomyces luteoverticillatus]|uniref:DUF2637 domain-containing protein n=1 Tax=Streptomyces luteoverticillatus TaxID=66425 RepID=A0A3S9PJU6_STRLT|nr:DUF2637 domain-containing protein [Streptomyces luteoverticillatus]AZQ72709.1 DUF2637 domain-containing protein [Streptomyces luteoverticillatus]
MTRPPRLDLVLVQAVIAGALSFAHLHDIAQAAGQDGWKGWAYPVSVDLLLVAAWRRLRSGSGTQLGWSWFLIALVASLGANVATAGFLDLAHPPAWLRMLVAGWPAAAFLGGTLLAHAPRPADDPLPESSTTPAPEEPSEAFEPEGLPADEPLPEATRPEETVLEPAVPAPAPPAPVQAAPAALVAHARKIADAYAASTGQPIDAETLRARLGVPAPMAEAITSQLA